MAKKTLLTVTAIALLLILPACSSGDSNNGGSTGFIGGSNGVQISFANDAPPSTIADRGQVPFDVIIEATNQGEANVPSQNATISLEGFSYDEFNVSQDQLTKNPPEDIPANRQTPSGEVIDASPIFTEYQGFNYVENVRAGYETSMIAEMCYEYHSQTSSELCVRDDLLTADGSSPCTVQGTRQHSSSGAPVKITKVNQEQSTSDRTILKLTVKNVGGGDAFQTGSTCNPGQASRVAGDARLSFTGLSGVDTIDCRGHERVDDTTFDLRGFSQDDLTNGEVVSCDLTIPEDSRTNRLEGFSARLDYLYETRASKTLTVRNSGG